MRAPPKIWSFLRKARLRGLGLGEHLRTLEGCFMVSPDMDQTEKLAMCIGIYAVSRTVMQARACTAPPHAEPLLRLHAREGLRGSQARKELLNVL